ncbi:hypothetical protein Poli38472_007400 [Pythium oligandrum]|uniref:Uncharacterized protein n=1 Tax=Pythium oligandrum TaxID=41045 RepID=A0A8K1CRN4_PYTOL|nr:hypothetical protein Poli38472_007400 [Pythium oligandrum]|eukprot:TMW67728.1 hypothetical protein Poli38472_007400 [Pythium oligandrum]
MVLSCGNQLCNVIEYRIARIRYYDVYVGRVIVNFPFDWMTVFIMTASVVHMYIFYVQYRCSGFEFINSVFCYTFFSSLLLTFNKTEAIRLTFDKLWWLYLSYFTFENTPILVSALYVLIFTTVNIMFQTRIVMNYFGFPSVEEYALVRSAGFRYSALAMDGSTFCVGFDAQNRYCVTVAKHFQLLSEPRFFRLDEMQGPVPTFDLWKVLQRIECSRHFHRKYDIPDLFKYLHPKALHGAKTSRTWKEMLGFRAKTKSVNKSPFKSTA